MAIQDTQNLTAPAEPAPTLSLAALQEVLWRQVQKLQAGDATPAVANAISNATGTILRGTKLQMEYYRMTGQTMPPIPLLNEGRE
jgi:hypothetical protein